MRSRSPRSTMALAIATALLAASPVQAQRDTPVPPAASAKQTTPDREANPEPGTLDTIVVTARQRVESLQDVPISVTAFSEQQIIDAGIEKPADFIQLTPNVSISEAQNAGTSALTIRGLTQVRNGEAPVATVIDGVQQVHPNQFNQDLYDIQSIEVLKGPQGAIYGRNAIGGAINIQTKLPPESFSGMAGIGVGNGGRTTAQIGIGGPIGQSKVRYQLSGSWQDFDGVIDNVFLNEKVDGFDSRNLRARLLADVTERLTFDLQASASQVRGGALNYVFQPLFGIDDPDDTSIDITANNRGDNRRDLYHFSFKGDYETDAGTLMAIVGYDEVREILGGDQFPYSPAISANAPFGPGTDGTQVQFLDVSSAQAEVRFTSPGDRRLRWIVGAYGLDEKRFLSSTNGLDLGRGFAMVRRTPLPNDPDNPTTLFNADENRDQSYALFGQLGYDITGHWEAALALRYDRERHEQRNVSTPQFSPFHGEERQAEFDKLQPKLTLTYKPDSNFTAYASYGEGFRSGGFNQTGTGAAAGSVGLVGVDDLYLAEVAGSAELGFKSRLAGGRLQLNGSVFDTSVDNQLYFVFVGVLGAQVLTNIDEVAIKGAELDLQFRLKDDLTVFGGYGMTRSKIERYALEPTAVGNESPYIPRYTSNIGFQYSPQLGDRLRLMLRLDYQRIGSLYWDPGNSRSRSSVDLLNLRAGIESTDGSWSATLWAKNALDEIYNSEYVLGGFAHRARPRTFGVDVRYNF